eukprot:5596197-Ditylum_brightwellii.AAC.1
MRKSSIGWTAADDWVPRVMDIKQMIQNAFRREKEDVACSADQNVCTFFQKSNMSLLHLVLERLYAV